MLGFYIESGVSTLPNGKFWEHVPYIGSRACRLMFGFELALDTKQFKVDQTLYTCQEPLQVMTITEQFLH